MVRDVNDDGLADVIIHAGYDEETEFSCPVGICDPPATAMLSNPNAAQIYLSTGTAFVPRNDTSYLAFQRFLGVADLNGDGKIDVISRQTAYDAPGTGSARPSVYFASSPTPNLLISVTDSFAAKTDVTYTPSAHLVDQNTGSPKTHGLPEVIQLVTDVRVRNGLTGTYGTDATTSYVYRNAAWDFAYRRNLGYLTVEATLPSIPGETEPVLVETRYLQSMAGLGKIDRVRRFSDGVDLMTTLTTWNERTALPFRAQKTQENVTVDFGGTAFTTRTDYRFDKFNMNFEVIEYGFVDGGDLDPDDNRITRTWFRTNTDLYIMDRPYRRRLMKGTATTSNKATWLWERRFSYDGLGWNAANPTIGM